MSPQESDRSAAGGRPAESRAVTRRRVLAGVAAGSAALAGCSTETAPGGQDGESDGNGSTGTAGGDGNGSTETVGGDGTQGTTFGPAEYDATVEHDLESWSDYDPEWSAPTTSPLETDLSVEVLVENLEIPWDLSFASDGTLFITERVGRLKAFDGEEVREVAEPADAIDAESLPPGSNEDSWYVQGGEGGTLGVAAHPNYPEPPLVYVYYTYRDDNDERYNRVDAFDVQSDEPGVPYETVVDGIPGDAYHNGGRISFGPENYLWITCGDGLDGSNAQDLSSLGGKVLRVKPNGDPVPSNPDLGSDADPRIYTYGHRNPQGIVWLPDGTPIATEHGPSGRDEINRLEAGANYGWDAPDEEGGDRTRLREEYPDADVHRPLVNTNGYTWAPTGSVFYTGDAVPALQNRVLTGGLNSQQLIATTVTPEGAELPPADDAKERYEGDWTDPAYTATSHTTLKDELGRIRHVEQGPDGALYAITSNRDGRADDPFPTERDDVLARIVPA